MIVIGLIDFALLDDQIVNKFLIKIPFSFQARLPLVSIFGQIIEQNLQEMFYN